MINRKIKYKVSLKSSTIGFPQGCGVETGVGSKVKIKLLNSSSSHLPKTTAGLRSRISLQ